MKKRYTAILLLLFFFGGCGITTPEDFVNDRVGYITFDTRTGTIEAHCRSRYMMDTRVERVRIFYDTITAWNRAFGQELEPQPLLRDFRYVIPAEVTGSLKPGIPFNIQVDPTTYDVLYVLRFSSAEVLKRDTLLKFTFKDYSRGRHGPGYPFF